MSSNNFIEINYGHWITQKTVFIVHSKLMYTHKSKISIGNYNSQIVKKDYNYKLQDLHNRLKHQILDLNGLVSEYVLQVDHVLGSSINKASNCKKRERFVVASYLNTLSHISLQHHYGLFKNVEKLWLVNPNLRLGITLIEKRNKCVAICFSSDIRIS